MYRDIVFKKIDNKITIIANEKLSFYGFIEALKRRLEKLYIKDDLLKSYVTLDIHNLTLSSKEILSLFDVLSMSENIYVNKIIFKESNNKNIVLYEGNIRAGEIRLFKNNVLIIGNINKGAKVIIDGNLYVIGKASGYIEFKNINNKLMASSIEDVYIKICSYEKQIENIQGNVIVSIDENGIVESNFIEGRERKYGKSNCSYIW